MTRIQSVLVGGEFITVTGTVTHVEDHATGGSTIGDITAPVYRWTAATLTSGIGELPLYVFPRLCLADRQLLVDGAHLTVHGRIDNRGPSPRLLAHALQPADTEATS